MEQVSEVGRVLVMEGFVCEEEDFELNVQWRFWRTGVMWSLVQVWVSR